MATERLQVVSRHLGNPKLHINPSNAVNTTAQNHVFRYTVDNPLLTYEQRIFYEENGYLVIPKLIKDDVLDEFSRRFVDYCNEVIPKGGITMMKDISLAKKGAKGEFLINKLQDIMYDEVFEKYFFHPKVLDYVSCFTGPNIRAMTSMLINKPPDSGALTSRHPLHQDLYYFPFRPTDRIVASWTAMEPVTLANGCLVVLPGTHKGDLLRHDYPKWEGGINIGYHGVIGYDKHKTVPLIMEKGDTVFFHPLLIHGSGANRTDGFRKAISGHYSTNDYHFFDVQGTFQEFIAEEIKQISTKKGIPLNIQEYWQFKSRTVTGQEFYQ